MLDITEATHDDSDPELLLAFKNKPIKKIRKAELIKKPIEQAGRLERLFE